MKILCFTSRVPWPLEKGDKLRVYHQLKQLAKNHEIILCCVNDTPLHKDALTELHKFCKEVHITDHSKFRLFFNLVAGLFSGIPLQVAYFTSGKAKRKFNAVVLKHKPDRIFCQLIRTAEYIRAHRNIPATIDYMDVFSKGVERRIDKVGFVRRPVFRMEWKRLLRYEKNIFAAFKGHCIISQQDRELLPVTEKNKVAVIPNGVDTDYFKPVAAKKEFELIFNGNMNYPPNVESVIYIVKNILPLLWKSKPDARLIISGASPSNEVLALRSEKVIVTGWVEDVRENFSRSKILVAPMLSSIGMQNKILEAMAMKIPCITTTLSNNAVGAVPDRQILVADSPEQFVNAICLLLDHPEKGERLAENGYQLVHEKFNWEQCCNLLGKVISDAGRSN
ncbi:MAG: glycosyltransferase [Bacteroidetes bacterium]|nr:glycosyltransferase [Bacteroidota bacterium]